jgi:23S rRNA (guanosine2251-2'-O)-methyltransferase
MSKVRVGRHSVFEALKVRPQAVSKVFASSALENKKWSDDLKSLCKKNQVPLVTKKESFFNNLCQNHQGLSCEVTEEPRWPDIEKEKLFLLALDGLEDPHNLGAIVRTAWLMGVSGILLSSKGSASITPTVSKVASGGLEHVPILKVKNLKQEIEDLKQYGFWSYALSVDENAEPLNKVTKSDKTILIAGAEEKGIKPTLIKSSDFQVFIPQKESEASYNVSVSVALGLWALK